MNTEHIWPMADDDDRDGGWTLRVTFLKAIQAAAKTHGESVSLEGVEGVLLAAQAHALLALGSNGASKRPVPGFA